MENSCTHNNQLEFRSIIGTVIYSQFKSDNKFSPHVMNFHFIPGVTQANSLGSCFRFNSLVHAPLFTNNQCGR